MVTAVLSGNPDAALPPTGGNLYGVTGNGDYDGVQNFGQSFVKLSPQVFRDPGFVYPFQLEIGVGQ